MKYDREKWSKVRIGAIAAFFIVFFVTVILRSFYLQVVKEDDWIKLADRQHQKVVPLTPFRGTIADCNGAPLAVSVEMDSCFAEPKNIEDPHDTAVKLSPLLNIPVAELEPKIASKRSFVWLARRVVPEVAKKVNALRLDGIGFAKESKRFYPNSEVAAHVVGFTGLDPAGLDGIEKRYDSLILGNNGYVVTERDALGRDIATKGVVVKNSSRGHNVTLTLDKNIQYIAEKELAKAVNASGAKGGIAVIMEPQTGKVLGIANYPNFNPNMYGKYSPFALRNHAVADSFEPGSTFKVFLLAAALEEKLVSPNDRFNCENGAYSIGGITIHDTHTYGGLTVTEILKYSSNIGAAKIGRKLGPQRLVSYMRNFGLGERTGIDLPGEAIGNLRDRSQWYEADLVTISFGQGMSASALQLTAAFSAIANGGVLMKPYLVEKIADESGTIIQQFGPQVRRRVVSADTARKITKMMETVTGDGGTGTKAAVEGFRVAGKTGTAQKVDPATRRYSPSKRTASFIGFVPADNPRLTIAIIIDEPKTSPYGGIVAAPAFSAIGQQALCYLKTTPTEKISPKQPVAVQSETKPVVAEVATAAEGQIDYGDQGFQMPNFQGMSMRQVLRVMEKHKLNVKLIGSGRAVEQNPPQGHRIGPDDPVWVKFTPSA